MRNRVGWRAPWPGIGHERAPSSPIDRRGRLMGTRRFDGYDCTGRRDAKSEGGGKSRLVDTGPESMSAKKAAKVAAGARPVQGRPPLP